MKIFIKRKFLLKAKRLSFRCFIFLPAVIISLLSFYFGYLFFKHTEAENFEKAPYFTLNIRESGYNEKTAIENDRDSPLPYVKENLPENIFPLATPDPSRTFFEVIETDSSREAGTIGISVNDSTNSGTDLKSILEESFEPDFSSYELFSGEPLVLIYHTHSCESFEQSHRGFYYEDETFRSTDPEHNVCAVGEAMKEVLEANGITVIHDTSYHDTPAFNGAYSRSEATVLNNLEKYPTIKITIDLHRDAMISDTGISYKPTCKTEGIKAAQMMIIAGCDKNNELGFENWEECLPFSLHLQKTAESLYPGLMRPLMFCNRKYNMGLTNTSFLLEVGTQSNTLSEAVYSGKLMGKILTKVITDNLDKD